MSFLSSLGSFASDNAGSLLQTGATLGSAGLNFAASNQAANISQEASQNALALRRDIYQQGRQDQAPYRAAGYGALDAQTNLLGIGDDPSAFAQANPWVDEWLENNPDSTTQDALRWHANRGTRGYEKYLDQRQENVTNRLRQTPGYQFRMNEGVEARDRSAAARGMALSGSQQKALTEFGQGLADQTYGQQVNRLAGLAGTGQSATNRVGAMGQQFAGGASNAMMQGADARASSYLTGANQVGQGLNSLAYIWGNN